MSMPPNLELDFQDYAPKHDFEAGDSVTTGNNHGQRQSQQPPTQRIVIEIPSGSSAPRLETLPKNSSLGNIFQSFTNFQASSESVNQASWLNSNRAQRQQHADQGGGGWGFNYLANYFDVTTEEVLQKIIWSALPVRKSIQAVDNLDDLDLIAPLATSSNDKDIPQVGNLGTGSINQRSYSYAERFIQGRSDLYGPIWISTTLIFVIAMFSNIGSYISFKSNLSNTSLTTLLSNLTAESAANAVDKQFDDWHYSMEELNMASSLVTSYVTFVPVLLWLLFWFRGCSRYYTLSETLCAYGYSLSIFIPTAMLLMVQATYIRYPLLALAATSSGAVLVQSFLPVTKSDPSPRGSDLILVAILVCHFLMAYSIHRIMLQ